MKKNLLFQLIFFFAFSFISSATIRYVNPKMNGLYPLEYRTIQQAIDAAVKGDTVRILPGVYDENINISKNIVVQGAGQQNTVIRPSSGPAVTMSNGKIMWLRITSLDDWAVVLISGIVTNCVICDGNSGISVMGTNGQVINCVIVNNIYNGISTSYENSTVTVINCIVTGHNHKGTSLNYWPAIFAYARGSVVNARYTTSYNNGYGVANWNRSSGTLNKISCWENDVGLSTDGDYRANEYLGDPDLKNPDGTRSILGYYGGPDAPIHPFVLGPVIRIQEDGTLKFEVQGKIGY